MGKVIPFAGLTVAVLLLSGALVPGLAGAQSTKPDTRTAPTPKPYFDVISIKVDNDPNVDRSNGLPLWPNGGLFSATGELVIDLISTAYNFDGYYTRALIPQVPKWANSERFDVQARAAGNPTPDQMRLMLQSLLADRFKFAMHYEDRQTQFYALELVNSGKLGPEIRPFGNDETCPTTLPPQGQTVPGGFPAECVIPQRLKPDNPGDTRWGFRDVSLDYFASFVSGGLDHPVLNQTGLTGNFDITAEYDLKVETNPAEATGQGPIEALRDQLGFKLEPKNGPVKTFVVDHIEEPTAN